MSKLSPRSVRPVIHWDRVQGLAKRQEPDYLLDTNALNAKYALRNQNPLRYITGRFDAPDGMSKEGFERLAKQMSVKFVESMGKRGWTLMTDLRVKGPQYSRDMGTGAVLLGQHTFQVAGTFATVSQPVRLELPPGIVRKDPEQKISLKEAARALGLDAVAPSRGG